MSKLTADQSTILAALADFLLTLGAAPAEAAPAEPEVVDDGLDALDRTALKQVVMDEELSIQVSKGMDDDAIRAAIREARSAAPADDTPAEPEAAPEDTPADPRDEVRELAKQLIAKKGDDAVTKILTKYKVDRISKLPDAKIAAVVKDIQAAIKGK